MIPRLRNGLPPLPDKMRYLPISNKGYPVPYFVKWIDGVPDFRVVDPNKINICLKQQQCWICGNVLGRHKAFSGGPLSAMNAAAGEPPSHRECAVYAAMSCPHMVYPKAGYREANMPEDTHINESNLDYSPGVNMVWVTDYFTVAPHGNGIIMSLGEPVEVKWFREGRLATRLEVNEAMARGVHALYTQHLKRPPTDHERSLVTARLKRVERYMP